MQGDCKEFIRASILGLCMDNVEIRLCLSLGITGQDAAVNFTSLRGSATEIL